MGVKFPHVNGKFLTAKRASPGHDRACPAVNIYSKQLSRGQHGYGADADWRVLDRDTH